MPLWIRTRIHPCAYESRQISQYNTQLSVENRRSILESDSFLFTTMYRPSVGPIQRLAGSPFHEVERGDDQVKNECNNTAAPPYAITT